MNEIVKSEPKNEIVVYQPNETVRLEVLVENETVWLTQSQLCELFGVVKSNVSYHLKNIFSSGELSRTATVQEIRTVQAEGGRQVVRMVDIYNLDVIISLGFRINSKRGIEFRQWATAVIKSHMLQGFSVNQRMIAMEDRIDRRLLKHDADIIELRKDVDFFISSSLPPKEKVFVEGRMLDAQAELKRIVRLLSQRQSLPEQNKDHPLHNNWEGFREMNARMTIAACAILLAGWAQGQVADAFAIPRAEFAKYHRAVTGREPAAEALRFAVDPSVSKSGNDAYAIRSVGEQAVITGSNGRSVLYGVYDLLERRGGCGWFWDGDRVPKKAKIDVSGLDVREESKFAYRGLRYFAHRGLMRFQAEHWGPEEWKREIDWCLKKRLNLLIGR